MEDARLLGVLLTPKIAVYGKILERNPESGFSSHTVTAVGPDGFVAVDFSGNHADIKVVFWAFPAMRALTQRAGRDIVSCRPVSNFAHTE